MSTETKTPEIASVEKTPVAKAPVASAKPEAVLVLDKDGKIVKNEKLTGVLFDLLNAGFYIKNNEQKGGITANRYGKKGELRIQLLADKMILSIPKEAPSVVDFDNYKELIKAN